MNKEQIIVGLVAAVLICLALVMSKDVIVVEYDKAQVDKQRAEYISQLDKQAGFRPEDKERLNWNTVLKGAAESKFPSSQEIIATNILGLKFEGQYYKYKLVIILPVLILGVLLIYVLKGKKKRRR